MEDMVLILSMFGALLVCLMLVLVFAIDRGLILWCGGLVLV